MTSMLLTSRRFQENNFQLLNQPARHLVVMNPYKHDPTKHQQQDLFWSLFCGTCFNHLVWSFGIIFALFPIQTKAYRTNNKSVSPSNPCKFFSNHWREWFWFPKWLCVLDIIPKETSGDELSMVSALSGTTVDSERQNKTTRSYPHKTIVGGYNPSEHVL